MASPLYQNYEEFGLKFIANNTETEKKTSFWTLTAIFSFIIVGILFFVDLQKSDPSERLVHSMSLMTYSTLSDSKKVVNIVDIFF